jgi:hypothetical protein
MLYSGKCEGGGPFNGMSLHHGTQEIEVAFRDKRPVTYFRSREKIAQDQAIQFGAYRHQDGRWIWHPPVSE